MTQTKEIYILYINADKIFADCIFEYIGAEKFDMIGNTIIDPYTDKEYEPKNGDLIIQAFSELDTEFPTALMKGIEEKDVIEYKEMLEQYFKEVKARKIIIKPKNFNPYIWENTVIEKHIIDKNQETSTEMQKIK